MWIIRDESQVNWIAPALRDSLSSMNGHLPLDVDIRIFVTQKPSNDVVALTIKKQASFSSVSSEGVIEVKKEMDGGSAFSESTATLVESIHLAGGRAHFTYGRPDLRSLIDEELAASDGLKVSIDGVYSFSFVAF